MPKAHKKGMSTFSFLLNEYIFAIIHQLFDRFSYIAHGPVGLLFLKRGQCGIPSLDQLLDRADVNIPVVGKGLQAGHILIQKPAVLPDRIAAQGGLIFLAVEGEKIQGFLFSALACVDRGLDPIHESRCLMVFPAPFIH